MKKIFEKITKVLMLIGIIFLALPIQRASAQPGDYVSFDEFYNDLAPYGQWIDDPQYGYVWIPDAEADFRPYYTDGHWVMTEYGNTWISDYSWGWAPFHYGRWTFDSYYGWIWIPGNEWGPAWVAWRYGEGYYGWAPLGPGIVISVGFGNYYCPDDWWVFIPPQYIYRPRYYNYWHGPRDNSERIRHTKIINNTYENHLNNRVYVIGPRAEEVQRVTNRPIKTYSLKQSTSPGSTRISDNTVALYHPMTISQNEKNGSRPTPPKSVRVVQPIGKPQAVGEYNGKNTPFKTGVQPKAHTTQTQPTQQQQQPVQYQPPVQYHQEQQPDVTPIHHYQPPQPPVQQQKPVQPQHNNQPIQHYNPPVQQQRGYTPPVQHYNPPVQQQRGYTPPPVQHYNPPVQQQRGYTPPPVQHYNPPVQQPHYNPPPQPPVQHYNPPPVQHNNPPVTQPQRNNAPSRR